MHTVYSVVPEINNIIITIFCNSTLYLNHRGWAKVEAVSKTLSPASSSLIHVTMVL